MTVAKSNVVLIEGQRLLTREQAAVYCGMSPNTFDSTIAFRLVSRRFGKRVMYDKNQIDATLDKLYGLTPTPDAGSEALRLLGQ